MVHFVKLLVQGGPVLFVRPPGGEQAGHEFVEKKHFAAAGTFFRAALTCATHRVWAGLGRGGTVGTGLNRGLQWLAKPC